MFGNVDKSTGEVTTTADRYNKSLSQSHGDARDGGTYGRYDTSRNQLTWGPRMYFTSPGNWSGDYWGQTPTWFNLVRINGEFDLITFSWEWHQPGTSPDRQAGIYCGYITFNSMIYGSGYPNANYTDFIILGCNVYPPSGSGYSYTNADAPLLTGGFSTGTGGSTTWGFKYYQGTTSSWWSITQAYMIVLCKRHPSAPGYKAQGRDKGMVGTVSKATGAITPTGYRSTWNEPIVLSARSGFGRSFSGFQLANLKYTLTLNNAWNGNQVSQVLSPYAAILWSPNQGMDDDYEGEERRAWVYFDNGGGISPTFDFNHYSLIRSQAPNLANFRVQAPIDFNLAYYNGEPGVRRVPVEYRGWDKSTGSWSDCWVSSAYTVPAGPYKAQACFQVSWTASMFTEDETAGA